MTTYLLIAAALTILIGLAHSYLGERYILIRLFRRTDLPRLFGSDWFTKRTLRFAWHITSIAWWGFAAILIAFAQENLQDPRQITLQAIAATFGVSAILTLAASRGRHLAWIVFLAIAVLSWLASG